MCRSLGPRRFAVLVLMAIVGLVAPVSLTSIDEVSVASAQASTAPSIQLVAARDHIEGALLTPRSIYADASRIYLAATVPPSTGRLFVLARDEARGFPVLQEFNFPYPLSAVTGDARYVYAADRGGLLHIFAKARRLQLGTERTMQFSYGLSDLAYVSGKLYVGLGQSSIAVNGARVLVAALNPGDVAQEVDPATLTVGRTFGTQFHPGVTQVFDRTSGVHIRNLPFRLDSRGDPGFPAVYADDAVLAATDGGGCCSRGFSTFDPLTARRVTHVRRYSVNTVARRGDWLVAGLESGHVEVFNIAQTSAQPVSGLDLRALTGHTGPEDIEIRALWTDANDDLVFAGSSWGNDSSRGPDLPAFFVLRFGGS